MANFTTNEILERESGHKHEWSFFDNYPNTFEHIYGDEERNPINPIGTVWECECGAREIRFIVWTGIHDPRKKGGATN